MTIFATDLSCPPFFWKQYDIDSIVFSLIAFQPPFSTFLPILHFKGAGISTFIWNTKTKVKIKAGLVFLRFLASTPTTFFYQLLAWNPVDCKPEHTPGQFLVEFNEDHQREIRGENIWASPSWFLFWSGSCFLVEATHPGFGQLLPRLQGSLGSARAAWSSCP